MQRNVITQSTLQPVQNAMNNVSANLAAHANASLSRAHGINLLYVVPGTVDEAGNDISVYRDTFGDVIGNYFVVFTINNQIYYAPGNDSVLPGQAANTGITPYGSDSAVAAAAKVTAWITDVISGDVAILDSINDDILLAHAVQGYWEAHGGMTISTKKTFDSIGHLIGNYVVRFFFDGVEYEIPCDKRLGGPARPVGNLVLSQAPTNGFANTSAGYYQHYEDRTSHGFSSLYPAGLEWVLACDGTTPITYTWYYFPLSDTTNNPTVPDLDDPAWVQWPDSGTDLVIADRTTFTFSINENVFSLTHTGTVSNFNHLTTWIKVTASNSAGDASVLLRFFTNE